MTTKKDITEIKKRFTKDGASFDKIAGCYVNADKKVVLTFNKTFLNLEDEDLYKYLEIAKKALSGKAGNNLLELPFVNNGDNTYGNQTMLLNLRSSGLRDEAVLNEFYQHIIDTYNGEGNFLIVLFHDTYDVCTKGSDNSYGDSEECFEYVIGAICPVNLSKAGLGYMEKEQIFAHVEQDWMASPVESAFMFPAFDERQTDVNNVVVYTKNAKKPHEEFWIDTLGVEVSDTSDQRKDAFQDMVFANVDEEDKDTMFNVNLAIREYVETMAPKDELVMMDAELLGTVMEDSGLSDDAIEDVKSSFIERFADENVPATDLIDNSVLKDAEIRIENRNLKAKVAELMEEIKRLKEEE